MKYFLHSFRVISKGLLLTLLLTANALSISGQGTKTECFEIKHLDFFGLDKLDFSWPDSEIDGLLRLNDEQSTNLESFLLPMILKQIAVYHSCFNRKSELERYFKLEKLYLRIRPGIVDKLGPISFIDQRLDVIRQDFYDQIQDDVLFFEMIYSMDDGPLTGEEVANFPKAIIPKSLPTKFGSLRFAQGDQRVFIGAFDRANKPIWIRVLKGTNPERYLKAVDLERASLKEFEAITVANLVVDGERLTIYVRPNGRLISYAHSW